MRIARYLAKQGSAPAVGIIDDMDHIFEIHGSGGDLGTLLLLDKESLEKVSKMRGVTYDRVDIDQSHAGIVAQELEAIAPELVTDGEYKSVAYGNLTAYLVEAIKELKAEIEELKNASN